MTISLLLILRLPVLLWASLVSLEYYYFIYFLLMSGWGNRVDVGVRAMPVLRTSGNLCAGVYVGTRVWQPDDVFRTFAKPPARLIGLGGSRHARIRAPGRDTVFSVLPPGPGLPVQHPGVPLVAPRFGSKPPRAGGIRPIAPSGIYRCSCALKRRCRGLQALQSLSVCPPGCLNLRYVFLHVAHRFADIVSDRSGKFFFARECQVFFPLGLEPGLELVQFVQ